MNKEEVRQEVTYSSFKESFMVDGKTISLDEAKERFDNMDSQWDTVAFKKIINLTSG